MAILILTKWVLVLMIKNLRMHKITSTKGHTTFMGKGFILMEIHMITNREDLSSLLESMQAHKEYKEPIISSQSHMRKNTKWVTIAISQLLDSISTDSWATKMKIMNLFLPILRIQLITTKMALMNQDHPTSPNTTAKEKKREHTSIQTLLLSSTFWVCSLAILSYWYQ